LIAPRPVNVIGIIEIDFTTKARSARSSEVKLSETFVSFVPSW